AAREYVAQTTLFTTHTPVPAGHDRFGEDLVRRYFGDAEEWVGLPWQRFLALGQSAVDAGGGGGGEFNMTYLAMHFAGFVNGVSKLHGAASRRLLHPFWPGLLADELPIASVTNGVHLATWTEPELAAELSDHSMGLVAPADFAAAERRLAPAKLWHVHQESKRRMLNKIRTVLTHGCQVRGESPAALATMLEGLCEDALYLGFARRFAPYKRAHLLFFDPERLRRILDHADRPVRIVVSGKAHPKDQRGQDIMKSIVQLARSPEFVGRVFFVEDYDMAVARALVQGVDVWVNTPTRMEEASGTSGMKAAANGVLNLSIADGWWPEAYDGRNGWQIGGERIYGDQDLQDQSDATALYRLLEEELVPLFFTRGGDGETEDAAESAGRESDVPLGWTQRMAHCLASVPPQFSTDRMVSDYVDKAYRPLASAYFVQQAEQKAPARERAREFARIQADFAKVRIVSASTVELANFKVGQHLDVRLDVDLGKLSPEDVVVELVVTHGDNSISPVVVRLEPLPESRPVAFEGGYLVERAGCYEHGMRIRVAGDRRHDAKVRGLVLWA
ncbi:MAG: alpha-glucan family phosphorylase, partial [Planctomycetota bacterium]